MSAGIPPGTAPIDMPKAVQDLSTAANVVQTATQAMENNKEAWRKVAKIVRQIDTCVDNTARTAHHRGGGASLPFVAIAALGATADVFIECASFMKDAAAKGAFSRLLQKSAMADAAAGYLSTVEGLQELLKAQNSECGLMTNPSADFGMLVRPIKDTSGVTTDLPELPDITSSWSKDTLDTNITKVDAAYDGFKTTLDVMVNITDGLPWPLKAAPQTLLYILKLFEDYRDAHPKITSLLYSVQQMWEILESVTKKVSMEDGYLQRRIATFLATLWRIVVRLRMVLRASWVKRAMAVHSVNTCLEVESRRIQAARDDISLTLQGETFARADATLSRVEETGVLVKEMHLKMDQLQVSEPSAPLASNISITTTLPPKPDVFHGRDEFVEKSVNLLIQVGTTRLAVLGAGGMGKTSVALAILHTDHVIRHFSSERYFISCEALFDADSLVIALAKLLGLAASQDLLTAVVSRLAANTRTLLVLDNLETVWLVRDATKVPAVERLLSTLSKIPTVSLIITCRGNVLPPRVRWSNASTAALAPFSLEAAMQTFEDTSGLELADQDRNVVERLLCEVDMMPLAVTLLGQLAQRGIAVSELLDRWTRTRNALLSTRPDGREYNIESSIGLNIELLATASNSPEPLQLLAICSMLPDGLRPPIFQELRHHFGDIDGARQALRDYALITVGVDGELKTLSPIRHFTLAHYPLTGDLHDSLCNIYFSLLKQLHEGMKPGLESQRAAVAAPEMGNLASLLPTLIKEPYEELVQAVVYFTDAANWLHPNLTVVCALLPNVQHESSWEARCLFVLGSSQITHGDSRSGLDYVSRAMKHYSQADDQFMVAYCMDRLSDAYLFLNEIEEAEKRTNSACTIYAKLGYVYGEARCRYSLGRLMKQKRDYAAAVKHLTAARRAFNHLDDSHGAAQCSEQLGDIYICVGDLDAAASELEAACSAFTALAAQLNLAQSSHYLGIVRRRQGNLILAEQLLVEADLYFKKSGGGGRARLALSASAIAHLRADQGRCDDAIAHFEAALHDFQILGWNECAEQCREKLQRLRAKVQV